MNNENQENTVLFGLSRVLFWDVDVNTLDAQKHAVFITERVLSLGTISDFKRLNEYYGKDKIKRIVKKIRYLNDREIQFCSIYYNIPLNKIVCYNTKQLNQTHWNY